MNCPNCGTSNPETASLCANCGKPLATNIPHSYTPPQSPSSPAAGAPIPNYLIQSVLLTICCCQPFGIVAIIFAALVNSRLASGDTAGALDASSKAKLFFWIGLILALVIWPIVWFIGGAAFLEFFRQIENL